MGGGSYSFRGTISGLPSIVRVQAFLKLSDSDLYVDQQPT